MHDYYAGPTREVHKRYRMGPGRMKVRTLRFSVTKPKITNVSQFQYN